MTYKLEMKIEAPTRESLESVFRKEFERLSAEGFTEKVSMAYGGYGGGGGDRGLSCSLTISEPPAPPLTNLEIERIRALLAASR